MHDIEFRRSALKEIKKLDNPIRREMVFQIENCAENPYEGKSLKGDLSGYLKNQGKKNQGDSPLGPPFTIR